MKKNYKYSSLYQVLDCFDLDRTLSPSEIAEMIWKSRALVHRYIWHLVEIGKLKKIGTAPHVGYALVSENISESMIPQQNSVLGIIPYQIRTKLDHTFLKFSPLGERWDGATWFQKWCRERWLDTNEKAIQYSKIADYIDSIRDDCWLLDATHIFQESFEKKVFSHVYYADQYTWMDFWRGKVAELTFYAKLTQNKVLLDDAISSIFPKLECLILQEKIDAIAITPWSIERKNQLLWVLGKKLKTLSIPMIPLVKYYRDGIAIPQKSLKTRQERIQNARQTIHIDDTWDVIQYQKILLIDDFVGSWATLYETALKLQAIGIPEIIGFAFVWNTNLKYEIINEI